MLISFCFEVHNLDTLKKGRKKLACSAIFGGIWVVIKNGKIIEENVTVQIYKHSEHEL